MTYQGKKIQLKGGKKIKNGGKDVLRSKKNKKKKKKQKKNLKTTLDLKHGVLIFEGCHNKGPKIHWLKQQKFIFSQSWSLEVQDQAGLFSLEISLLGLLMVTFSLCPHIAIFPSVSVS